nr:g-type lectin s-receptor-like serine/threonine-protein kinase [Quercus suber]
MHYQTGYKGDDLVNAIQIPTRVEQSLYNIPLDMPSFCSYNNSFGACLVASHIGLGSRLLASEDQTWVSDNGTFAFGFTPAEVRDQFELAIWFAELLGDRTIVWSANRNSPITNNAILELDTTGNLVLIDGDTTVWMSNTSSASVEYAVMSESGNFILYSTPNNTVWQSFSHPTDTLLPNQPLTVSLELTTSNSASQGGGYYTLKMLQQPNSLTLALTYNLPKTYNNLPESFTNYSYWQAPVISNVTGDVVAVLDDAGSFGIVYGEFSDGAVYVYKNNNDIGGLSATSNMTTRPAVLRRLSLETNGNIRLYRWDDDVNSLHQWVPEWAAVSNPCDIAGICGNGVCNLDRSETNACCTCLPGTSEVEGRSQCSENSLLIGKCDSQHKYSTSEFRISTVQQTNYYYSYFSVIANYSDIAKCGDACLSDCECVASVYGLDDGTPYCWVLRSLDFGGFEDADSTLFVKVRSNGSNTPEGNSGGSLEGSKNAREKVLVIPIALSITVLIGLLCLLLYYNIHRRRALKRALESSLILSGAPLNFSYRELQTRTWNFSQLLGTGGFGNVYKGSLADGTLVAVKKLDRVLPHGEKEFITEVNTIGSMHHMNLVRLCGYCSEGSQRLLVYEFMKNGRNLDTSLNAEDFFFPGWAFKMTNGTPIKVADRRLQGAAEEEELVRALKVAFWCIQDEVFTRPSMGEVVKMLEGSIDHINMPPMPQTVLELIEEGLDQVYKAMKTEFNQFSSFTINSTIHSHRSSQATCSYSTMSPR